MARDIASFMPAVQWCQHPRQWHKHRQMPLPMLMSLSGQVVSLCRAPVYGHDRSIQIVTWTYVNMLSTFVFTVYWAVQCLSLLLLSSNAFADCWIFKVFLCQSALIFVFFNKLASGYIWMNVKDCWLCDIMWFDSPVCVCLCACVYTCMNGWPGRCFTGWRQWQSVTLLCGWCRCLYSQRSVSSCSTVCLSLMFAAHFTFVRHSY